MALTILTGNTFPVRHQLAAMGARWSKTGKHWTIEDYKVQEAQKLIDEHAKPAPVVGDTGAAKMNLRAFLSSLSKEQVLDQLCRVRESQTCGFNHELVKKAECIALLVEKMIAKYGANAEAISRQWAGAKPPGQNTPLQQILEQTHVTPLETPQTMPTPVAVAPTDAGSQIAALIASIAGQSVNEARVREIALEIAQSVAPRETRLVLDVRQDDGTTISIPDARPELQRLVARARAGRNLMMVGPAGSGKTFLAWQIAEALGRPFASISCTAGMSEAKFEGWLVPGPNGEFIYLTSDFVRMYEQGGVFLFDEGDAADANTLLFINQALAGKGFFLPQRKDSPFVARHKDFVAIMACNTYGTGANMVYAGRERLDESTLDRFRAGVSYIGYDATLEERTVEPGLLRWARNIRTNLESSGIQRVMSTRFLMDATSSLQSGADTFESIKETYFLGWREDEIGKVEFGI